MKPVMYDTLANNNINPEVEEEDEEEEVGVFKNKGGGMPRPGPRPYECVRRAWHSERHHPMRGSLIQEIFRVVNEIHGSSTRRNKEWQEKLPVVVLKAEEIIYSKANSEAEYIDLSTLLDRTNDAIDTIIRRDHSIEIGEPLHPCIEAALTLGCTPRRASRSQRNDSLQSYLRQRTWALVESNRVTVGRLAMGNDLGVAPDNTNSMKAQCFPLCLGNSPGSTPSEGVVQLDSRQRLPGPYGLDSSIWSYSGYPLYSRSRTQFGRDTGRFEVVPSQCGIVENAMGAPHSLIDTIVNDASEESNCERTRGSPQCDLSLRLGPNPVTGIDAGNIPNGNRLGTLNHRISTLLGGGSMTDAPVWCMNKRSFLGEHLNRDQETPSRKKISNDPYRYRPQFGPPFLASRRDDPWRNQRRKKSMDEWRERTHVQNQWQLDISKRA